MSEPTEYALNETIDSLLSAQYEASVASVGPKLMAAVDERKRIKGIVMGMFRAQRERIAALEAEAAKLYPEVAEARSIDLVEDHFMQQYNANRALRKHLNRALEECEQLRAIAGGMVNSQAKFYEQPQTYDAALRRIDAEVARCYGIEHP